MGYDSNLSHHLNPFEDQIDILFTSQTDSASTTDVTMDTTQFVSKKLYSLTKDDNLSSFRKMPFSHKYSIDQ